MRLFLSDLFKLFEINLVSPQTLFLNSYIISTFFSDLFYKSYIIIKLIIMVYILNTISRLYIDFENY